MNAILEHKILIMIKDGFSDAYIQSVIWSMRDDDTSIDEISKTITRIRKEEKR